ncbi:MAG: type II secretion system F family protein [Bifidobacteriaceae bacterium]|jgi:tight adherence protein C|nr:type II secretion system F family protein [Bifidobacteriaceae bacterium]
MGMIMQEVGILGILVYLIGGVVVGFWVYLFQTGMKYSDYFAPVEEKDFPLKDLYFVGYRMLEMMKYPFNSRADESLKTSLAILYEAHNADYYLVVVRSSQYTLAITASLIGFILYGLSGELMLVGFAPLLGGLAFYYFGDVIQQKIAHRKQEMVSDFAEVISELALLTNTGMILRKAWTQTAQSGTSLIYREMMRAADEMENGVSDSRAINTFGVRSQLPEIRKVTSFLTQGLSKGNAELVNMLFTETKEVWELKKQMIHRQVEAAGSKLMAPMMIMFVGVLIIVLVPMALSMSM